MEDLSVEENHIEESDPPWFRLRAAFVHLYTASGAVLALLILVAAYNGNAVQALWLMLAALLIDSTDGLLARRLRVSEALPSFDGARLDDIVDYITYVFAPMVLLWSGGYLPEGTYGLVLAALAVCWLPATSSAGWTQKTDDHFFLGFPSYFNVVVFYAIVFDPGAGAVAAMIITCSVLVFVPIRYVYPTRTAAFRRLSLLLTALWLLSYAVILLQMPKPEPLILGFSIFYLVYYLGLSLYLNVRMLAERRANQSRSLKPQQPKRERTRVCR